MKNKLLLIVIMLLLSSSITATSACRGACSDDRDDDCERSCKYEISDECLQLDKSETVSKELFFVSTPNLLSAQVEAYEKNESGYFHFWTSNFTHTGYVRDIKQADLDADGIPEVIATLTHTSTSLLVLNSLNGSVLWANDISVSQYAKINIVNAGDKSYQEVLLVAIDRNGNGGFYIYDHTGHLLKYSNPETSSWSGYTGPDEYFLLDVNADNQKDLILTFSAYTRRYSTRIIAIDLGDGENHTIISDFTKNLRGVTQMSAGILTDGRTFVSVSGWGIGGHIIAFDLFTGNEIWRTIRLPGVDPRMAYANKLDGLGNDVLIAIPAFYGDTQLSIYLFNATTGNQIHRFTNVGTNRGMLIVDFGHIQSPDSIDVLLYSWTHHSKREYFVLNVGSLTVTKISSTNAGFYRLTNQPLENIQYMNNSVYTDPDSILLPSTNNRYEIGSLNSDLTISPLFNTTQQVDPSRPYDIVAASTSFSYEIPNKVDITEYLRSLVDSIENEKIHKRLIKKLDKIEKHLAKDKLKKVIHELHKMDKYISRILRKYDVSEHDMAILNEIRVTIDDSIASLKVCMPTRCKGRHDDDNDFDD